MRLTSVLRAAIPAVATLWMATGCSFLIPENESAPRYNTVLGERRMPAQNAASMKGGAAMNAAPVPVVQQTPLAQQQQQPMDLPPVDPAIQREAQARMQMAQAQPQQQEEGFFDSMAFWRSGAAPDASMRSVPEENRDYPVLTAVPPRPAMTGPDAASTRLNATRSELEQDRIQAGQAASQLNRDAASEPSLLNEPRPVPVVPAPEPVSSAPIPPPGYASAPAPLPMSAVPFPDAVAPQAAPGSIAMLPPPPPVYAQQPAPAPMPMAAAPAPMTMGYPVPANEPIILRAPAQSAPPPAFVATPAPMAAAPQPMAPAMSGGFDPMAGAAPRTSYSATSAHVSNGYLPSSRYTARR